ncbi:hypothetical protein BGZ70_004809 [Mortierella alpina]|uniref:FAD-binding domain-containing protein n=1 Tax=Mortierella alpina TaxID=64518 RepID=A0A9P6M4S7_MORAP|nr:hypothetical protein BGZ70_004809 [Mortierella alpina]
MSAPSMIRSPTLPPTNNTTTSFSTTYSSFSSGYPYSSNMREEATFKVLIVGAGIGGLMLGYCLERAGIDYVILERMNHFPVPKATIQLTSNTLHLIEQLGLLDEIMKIAKPVSQVVLRKHNMAVIGKIDCLYVKQRMREGCVQWGRYVLEVVSGNGGVQCRCANGHVEQGDVLVGADGAHSAVRQNMYKTLRDKGILPKVDSECLKFTQNAIMGSTEPMDEELFPDVGKEFGDVHIVIGKESPYTMWITPALGNTINWCVTGPMLTTHRTEENFMVSGFGPEEAEKTCQMIKHLQIPYGGTLERLIQNTARNNINKILVEEKYYKTWYYGRTVLIGEACHKFVSFSGQGAEQAILDAVSLVNLFHKIEHPYPLQAITNAFEKYHLDRLPATKAAIQTSGQLAGLINRQGWSADFKRKMVFNLPTWVQAVSVDKMQVRPQLDFLPLIVDRGSKSVRSLSLKSVSGGQ